MEERLSDDAVHIQRILPWLDNKEDIVNVLRKIPIEQSHIKIPLTIRYFCSLRDENEENSEQNIENDARDIVITLPDTPYTLIKNRLRELGNMPNRKEIVVKQLINDRPELNNIIKEVLPPNNIRKRASNGKETNIKIKIRNVDGSLEASIVQEHLRLVDNTIDSLSDDESGKTLNENKKSQLIEVSCSDSNIQLPSTSNCVSTEVRNVRLLPSERSPCKEIGAASTSSYQLPTHSPKNTSSQTTSSFINISFSESNKQLPYVHEKPLDMEHKVDQPSLIEYLKELTNSSEETIKSVCKRMNISTSKKPSEIPVINELLNRIFDYVSESDDSDTNPQDEYINRRILKPASFVIPDKMDPPKTHVERNIIRPAKLNLADVDRRPAETFPAMPQAYLNALEAVRDGLTPDPIDQVMIDLDGSPEPAITQNSAKNGGLDWIMVEESPLKSKKVASTSSSHASTDTVVSVEEIVPIDDRSNTVSELVTDVSKITRAYDEKLVARIMEMFPEACPTYIKDICRGRRWNALDDVVTDILSEESYPKRQQKPPSPQKEYDIEEQLEIVKALLPEADPTFLRWKCETIGNNTEALNEFINEARETQIYPTMKDYLRKQKLSAQSKQYTTDFNVENFVQLFPDPEKTFRDPSRMFEVDHYAAMYICLFFQNRYDRLPMKLIRSVLSENKNRITLTDDALKTLLVPKHMMKSRRKQTRTGEDVPQNITVLQEIAYLTHKEEIAKYIQDEKEREKLEQQMAKEQGLMNTCECCYDDEVMPKDTFYCPKECTFCRSCIQKSCEVAFGDGKTEFNCLNHCSEEFALHTLQKVLPPKMFSKVAQKKALAEVKAAGIEELESCPFCDFASIPNPTDKIFRCLNPDCMKESCRQCREENHVPYRCDEIEKDDDVKARVFVENKMTEALLRKCWKCCMSFFKEEGCNMMTCTCGAKMCYICQKPVQDYKHFNGIGGDKFELCPLYSDTNDVNHKNVIKAAEEAKSQVDPNKLKIDPALDVKDYYEKRKRELPQEPHVALLADVRRAQEQAQNNNFRRMMLAMHRVQQHVQHHQHAHQHGHRHRFGHRNERQEH